MHTVPMSAALVAWGNAWLTGHVGLDDAVDEIERTAGPQMLADQPLRWGLAKLRVEGMSALRLALPSPGDPLGLAGPPPFTVAAVEAGQAAVAVLPDACAGLVPAQDRRGSSYVGVHWTRFDADPATPDVPSLAEADNALSAAIREVTEILLRTNATASSDSAALAAVRESRDTAGLAPGYPARAHRLAAQAGRLATVLRVAASEVPARAEALRELDRAVRRAQVAACNSVLEGTLR